MIDFCSIRPVVFDDLPLLLAWRNHGNIRKFMLTQHEIGLEEHQNWFARASLDPGRRLLIVEEQSAGPLGYIQFNNVRLGGVAEWGFYAQPEAPQGAGTKLGYTALRYAFGELKLHKVCGQAIESNAASISFHKRLGFTQEGVLRDQTQIDGVYQSLVCFGLLASEWAADAIIRERENAKD